MDKFISIELFVKRWKKFNKNVRYYIKKLQIFWNKIKKQFDVLYNKKNFFQNVF